VNCLQVRELLPELAVGVLSPEDQRAVEQHLQWCAGCRKEANELGSAAATFAFALAPAPVPSGLGEHVVTRVRNAAGAPGSRRRMHTAVASIIAAMVAVSGLGWGAVMAGRADRFAERARQAQLSKELALEQFQKVLAGAPVLGDQVPTSDTHLGRLAPTSGTRVGGGAVLQLVSPTTLDFSIVIVNGLDPTDAGAFPYRVTLSNAVGEVLRAGVITALDNDGGASVFHQFNLDLTGFTTVEVTNARGELVLRGSVDQSV
jgi:anti-sigma factor RsiW